MFPRKNRLSREEFPSALNGRRVSSPNFSVVISPKAQGYAVVVPKKIARLAVTRHRIKRRVLAALRSIPLPKSVVIFPKTTVATMPYQDVQKELSGLLSKYAG